MKCVWPTRTFLEMKHWLLGNPLCWSLSKSQVLLQCTGCWHPHWPTVEVVHSWCIVNSIFFHFHLLAPLLISLPPCHVSPSVIYLSLLHSSSAPLSPFSPQAIPTPPPPSLYPLPACVALCASLPFMTCNPCLLNKVPVPLRVENEP